MQNNFDTSASNGETREDTGSDLGIVEVPVTAPITAPVSTQCYWKDVAGNNIMFTVRLILATLSLSHRREGIQIGVLSKETFKWIATIAFKLIVHEIKPLILETFGRKLPRTFESLGIDTTETLHMTIENGTVHVAPNNNQSWVYLEVTDMEAEQAGGIDHKNQIVIRFDVPGGKMVSEEVEEVWRLFYVSKSGERLGPLGIRNYIQNGDRSTDFFQYASFPKDIDMVLKFVQTVISDTHELPEKRLPNNE